jgi:hypothetical protein
MFAMSGASVDDPEANKVRDPGMAAGPEWNNGR